MLSAWLGGQQALASDPGADAEKSAFTLRGFGSVGLARSNNARAELLTDLSVSRGIGADWSHRSDSALGLQVGYALGERTELAAQAVSHYRSDDTYRPEVTLAFLRHDFTPRLSLRLGRVGTELLMQADTRRVGYSYLPVRPAIEFFGPVPINYGDGVDARLRWPLGEGVVVANGFIGVAREALVGLDPSGASLDLDGFPLAKAALGYEEGPWSARYIYGQLKFESDLQSLKPLLQGLRRAGAGPAARELALDGSVTHFHSLGAVYDDGAWEAQAALGLVRNESSVVRDARSGYVLVGRHFGQISPFVGYSRVRSERKSVSTGLTGPHFAALNGAVAAVTGQEGADRKTYSLGARWDFRRNVDLKVQMDFVRSDEDSSLLLGRVKPGWNGKATVLSLSLDFVF